MEGTIEYQVNDNIARIIINRPQKLNSITKAMGEKLNHISKEINDDDSVHVVLLAAQGSKSFSTGSDINMLDQYGSPYQLSNRQDYCAAIRSIRKPVVSKIKGYALGGGLELVLATDIRIATEDAIFGVSEVQHGWISGSGATQLLARTIGYNRAAELVLTGDKFSSEEAFRLGVINRVVNASEIDEYVETLLKKLAAQSSTAMQLIKRNLRASQNMPMDMGLAYENDLFAFSFTTDDAKEGKAAFAEKRKPHFNK